MFKLLLHRVVLVGARLSQVERFENLFSLSAYVEEEGVDLDLLPFFVEARGDSKAFEVFDPERSFLCAVAHIEAVGVEMLHSESFSVTSCNCDTK